MTVEKRSLIIVESPTKARTIQKYVGSKYVIKASVGHIKDLPKSKMGVRISEGFEPEYAVIKGKQKVVAELRKAAKDAETIFLAPDPDREGEAIAWHIAEELGLSGDRAKRVLFNEITKRGIADGLSHPVPLDRPKFESQQARRILDRLVGYEVSPLLWRKIQRGLSAGRVQSVALRLIVEREDEIRAFTPEEYWNIQCELLSASSPNPFIAKLASIEGTKADIHDQPSAEALRSEIETGAIRVQEVERKTGRRSSPPPFITSKLQQEAARRFRFAARRTMRVAQELYEGIGLGEEGAVGLITYMRTDSTRMSEDAVREAREFVTARFGADYVPEKPNRFASGKSAQDAHEAIRPTSLLYPPDRIKSFLSPDQLKLYRLIWNRFLASQMTPAVYDTTNVRITAGREGRLELRVQGKVLKFPGWLAASEVEEETPGSNGNGEDSAGNLPPLVEGEPLALQGKGAWAEQKFTQPPPRFTEGTLIRELEEKGIGRPSTYATIVSTIQDRRYVVKEEAKLVPTELGFVVSKRLVRHFPAVFNVEFTAKMEESLDRIEEGKEDWVGLLRSFYAPFHEQVEKAFVEMEGVKAEEVSNGETCELCGAPMAVRWGRHGRFLSCSTYPKCKSTRPLNPAQGGAVARSSAPIPDVQCDKCGRPMVRKHGRFGEFLACSGYPECKGTRPIPIGVSCPRPGCGGDLIERRTRKGRVFYGCSNYNTTRCDFTLWTKPVAEACPSCGAKFLVHQGRGSKARIVCVSEGCGYSKSVE